MLGGSREGEVSFLKVEGSTIKSCLEKAKKPKFMILQSNKAESKGLLFAI